MDTGFVWDTDKYEPVQEQHNVVLHEVVSAFDDPDGLEEPDPRGDPEQYLLLARTHTDRILQNDLIVWERPVVVHTAIKSSINPQGV